MSLLLAQPVSNQRATHPELEARGYKGFTTCPLSVLCPIGIPISREIAYGEYETHIALFLAATAQKTRLITSADGATIPKDHEFLQLQPPPVVFSLPQRPNEDGKRSVLKKLEKMQPSYEERGNRHMFILHQPDYAEVEKLVDLCGQTPAIPGNAVHCNVLSRVKWLLQIVHLFCATHTYSAFQEEDLDFIAAAYDKDEDVEDIMGDTQDITSWKWINTVGRNVNGSLKHVNDSFIAQLSSRRAEIQAIVDSNSWETDTLMKKIVEPLNLDDAIRKGMRTFSVPVATPSNEPPTINCGPIASIPENTRGLLFPFVEGMNMPDERHLSSIILRRFIRLLGTTELEIARGVKSLKRDISQISTTQIGMILSHIFTGMDIALGAQARLFLIVEGPQYLGFVLMGTRFLVSSGERVYSPRKPSELQAALSKLKSSSSARKDLATWLSAQELISQDTEMTLTTSTVSYTDLKTAHDVLAALMKRKISSDKMTKEFYPIYTSIRFEENFRPLTLQMFLETLELMTKPKSEDAKKIIQSHHIYIPSDYACLSDNIGLLLATHGPEVFGPFSSKGADINVGKKAAFKQVVVDKSKKGKTKQTTIDAFGIPPDDKLEKIILARVGITRAVKDWESFISKGDLRFDPKERAQGSRGVVIQGDLCEKYQATLADLSKDREQTGQKRKRTADDEQKDAKKGKLANDFFGFEF